MFLSIPSSLGGRGENCKPETENELLSFIPSNFIILYHQIPVDDGTPPED
jgi:hypothetical protein